MAMAPELAAMARRLGALALALAPVSLVVLVALAVLADDAAAAGRQGWTSSDGEIALLAPTIILPDQVIDHDILELGNDVQVYGIVRGDVLAICGDVYVFGRLEGDAMAIFGRVIVRGDAAQVTQDAAVIGGSVVLDGGGSVLGDTRVSLPLAPGAKATYLRLSTQGEVLILRLVIMAGWTLLALLASLVAPATLMRASLALRRQRAGMILIGALFHLSALLSAILCTALIALFVGVPLLGLLLIALVLIEALSLAAVFHFVGERLVERFSSHPAAGHAKIFVGALVLTSLSFVPIFGEILWLLIACAGSGALLATWRWSRRRER